MSNPLRRFLNASEGVATTEFVLTIPVLLALASLIFVAGDLFSLERKLTQAARTLTDLASQQSDLTPSGPYPAPQILNAASLVIAPYDASALNMKIAELQNTDPGVSKYIWCAATPGEAEACKTLVGTNAAAALGPKNGYWLTAEVSYTYQPLAMLFPWASVTFSRSQQFLPRSGASIKCCASS